MQGEKGMKRTKLRALTFVALLFALVAGAVVARADDGAAKHAGHTVAGAGKTIIEGGTGGTTPLPVTTILAFHADELGGDFECLALAPKDATSGEFTSNAMYVTGKVTSVAVVGETATLRGIATVTGLGAGAGQSFIARVTSGGPGATITLEVSGLTFHEILLEGNIGIH